MNGRFIARVVDVNDPEQAGRLRIRIFGMHDDEQSVPDNMLPWARCIYPVTNPVSSGIAGPITGVVVGTVVVGTFADGDIRQIPIVEGTLGRNSDTVRDFPKANAGEDFNEVLEDSIFNVATSELKFIESKTIGSIEYTGQNIEDMVGFIENGQFSNAIQSMRQISQQIQSLRSTLIDAPVEQLNSIISGFTSDLTNAIDSTIEEGLDDLNVNPQLVTGVGGSIFGAITGRGEIVPPTVSDTIGIVTNIDGVEFDRANHLVGSISERLSKKSIGSSQDAVNRVSGLAFTMTTRVRSVERTFDQIKRAARRKNNG
jgi:hypothetical protein